MVVTWSGLDLANSPYMAMGSAATSMNMNGADASAAAGFNTTKTNWHYTGPALPNALAQQFIEGGPNGPGDIHMAVTGCAVAVTASQGINATQYVQSTSQARPVFDPWRRPWRPATSPSHRPATRW